MAREAQFAMRVCSLVGSLTNAKNGAQMVLEAFLRAEHPHHTGLYSMPRN